MVNVLKENSYAFRLFGHAGQVKTLPDEGLLRVPAAGR